MLGDLVAATGVGLVRPSANPNGSFPEQGSFPVVEGLPVEESRPVAENSAELAVAGEVGY